MGWLSAFLKTKNIPSVCKGCMKQAFAYFDLLKKLFGNLISRQYLWNIIPLKKTSKRYRLESSLVTILSDILKISTSIPHLLSQTLEIV